MLHAVKIITAQKIIRLDEQIAAARDGNPVDFEEWKATTDVVLRYAVGDNDRYRRRPLPIRRRPLPIKERSNMAFSARGAGHDRSRFPVYQRSAVRSTSNPAPSSSLASNIRHPLFASNSI
jgi:hypothetical protein